MRIKMDGACNALNETILQESCNYTPIELMWCKIDDGLRNESQTFGFVDSSTPIILRLKIKDINKYYKIDKIQMPCSYLSPYSGVVFEVVQGNFSYYDSIENISNALNGTNKTIQRFKTEISEDKQINLDITSLDFRLENNELIADFAIINNYNGNSDSVRFSPNVAYIHYLDGDYREPLINVELFDKDSALSKINCTENMQLDVKTGQLKFILPLYQLQEQKYNNSLFECFDFHFDENGDISIVPQLDYKYTFNENLKYLKEGRTSTHYHNCTRLIRMKDYLDKITYFVCGANNDQTSELFEKFKVQDKTICAFSMNSPHCMYYHNGSYVIKDLDGNKVYLDENGYITKTATKYETDGQYTLLYEYEGGSLKQIKYKNEVIYQKISNTNKYKLVTKNIYIQKTELNNSQIEYIYTNENNKDENNKEIKHFRISITSGDAPKLIVENLKENTKIEVTYINQKVYSVISKRKNESGVFVDQLNKYYFYYGTYTKEYVEQTKEEIKYLYDEYGNITSTTNNLQNESVVVYNESYNIFENITLKKDLKDVVLNGDFKQGLEHWTGSVVDIEEDLLFGKCAKILDGQAIYQNIELSPGDTYKVEGYIKHTSNDPFSVIVLELGYTIEDSSNSTPTLNTQVAYFEADQTKTGWYHFETNTNTLPENAKFLSAVVQVDSYNDILYVANIQVVTERKKVNNLVKNDLFNDTTNNLPNEYMYQNLNSQKHTLALVNTDELTRYNANKKELFLSGCDKLVDQPIRVYQTLNKELSKGSSYLVQALVKTNITADDEVSNVYVELLKSGVWDKFKFNAQKNKRGYQKVLGIITLEKDYTNVRVGYEYKADSKLYINHLEFVEIKKSKQRKFDEYLQETFNDTLNEQQINTLKNNKTIKQVTTNGLFKEYEYNDNNDLIKETDSLGRSVIYEYNNYGKVTKLTQKIYDDVVNEIRNNYYDTYNEEIDVFNSKTTYKLNSLNEINQIYYPNNLDISYTFNSLDHRLIDKLTAKRKANTTYNSETEVDEEISYNYDEGDNLVKVTTKNQTSYQYIYSQNGNLLKVIHDGTTLEEYAYNYDLSLKELKNLFGTYQYIYDDKHRISIISYYKTNSTVPTEITYFTYNKYGNIEFVSKPRTNEAYCYIYNDEGRLEKYIDEKEKTVYYYEYDLTGNLVSKTRTKNNVSRTIYYDYALPETLDSPEKEITKTSLKYYGDVMFFDRFNKGLFGLESTSSNFNYETNQIDNKKELKISNVFENYEYDIETFYKDVDKIYSEKRFITKQEILNSLSCNKTFSTWIKPSGRYNRTSIFELFTKFNNVETKVADLNIENDGKLALYINGQLKLKTNTKINLNGWNFISLSIHKYGAEDIFDYIIKLNDENKTYHYDIEFSLYNTKKITFGKDLSDGSLSVIPGRTMPLSVSMLMIDAYEHTETTLNELYENTKNLFLNQKLNHYVSTRLVDSNDEYNFKSHVDAYAKITKKELVMNNSSKFNQTYEYNKIRIEKETNSKGYITTYTYDNMNNITKKETKDANDQITESHEYTYDLLGRITYEKFDNIKYNYSYNQNGNIKNIDTIDEYNEIIQNIHFTYDNTIKDKLKSYTIDGTTYELTYTNEFYPTNLKGLVCEWDENKLKKVGNTTYTYNSNGQRIKKQKDSLTHTYVYDGNKLIKEEIKNPQTQVDVTLEYIYDQSDMLVAVLENNNLYYYERDLTGEIKGIVDTNGNYVVKYRYKAFGEVEKEQNITNNISTYNPFMYKGYYYDVETQLYWVSSRYYSPELCRWISPDSIEYLNHESINGLNLYAYCNNDPVNYYDPTGHSAIVIGLIIGAIIGAGIGFGTVAYTDYQDDGQIFNGSVKWYEYVGGTVTGAVLGAGVGGIIGAGGAVLSSALVSTGNKFISDLFAYTLTGTSFGTWEDYAVAFISGGLIKGLGMKGIVKTAYDVALRPAINQAVKIGTNRTETFSVEKYAYDVVTRGLTTLAPSPWKAFYRGGFRSMWDLYKRGYFA